MTMLPAFHSLNACSRIVHRAGRNSVLLCSRRHATTLVTSRNKSDRQSDPSPEPQTHKIRGKTIKSPQAVQKELVANGSQQARAERLWNEDMQRLMYDKDPDDKLAQLHAGHELIRSYGDSNSVPLPLLDHNIPYSVSPTARKHYPTTSAMFYQLANNLFNSFQNFRALYELALFNGVPGQDLPRSTFWQSWVQWPLKSLQTQSVKPTAWIAPFRQTALEVYKSLNTAIAKQDKDTVKLLARGEYSNQADRLMRKRVGGHTYIWRFHRELSPTRVISLRGMQAFYGKSPPKSGNRNTVQALVRFDTEQSLEVYDQYGKAVHTPAKGAAKQGRFTPAERKRVEEFLVLEKRMFYEEPWGVKDQLYPTPGRRVSV